MTSSVRSRRNDLLIIMGVLLAAFAIRMGHLNSESIWHDEGWSIRAFRSPFTTPDDNTPYLYYLSGHVLWRLGGGESALALRYISVLIGTLTVALALRVGWRWFGFAAGIAAGLLVGFSPLLWEYSQEVRAYVAVPLVALGLLAGAEATLKRLPGQIIPRRVWGFVFAAELAGLYTHNLTVPLIVWLNVALGMVWLLRCDWRHMLTWAGVQIALMVGYIPWLLTQSPSGTPLNTPPVLGLGLVRDVWYSYFLPVLPQLRHVVDKGGVLSALVGACGVILLAGVGWYGWVQRRGMIYHAPTKSPGDKRAQYIAPLPVRLFGIHYWLLVSHAVLVPAFSTALMIAAHIDFHPRYYIAAVPGTFLLVSGLFVNRQDAKFAKKRVGAGLRPAQVPESFMHLWFVFPALLIAALSLHQIMTTREYQHDDFAELAAYYATLPADTAIVIPFDAERALQDYYDHRLDIQAEFVNIPLYADEAEAVSALNDLYERGFKRVELLTWFQLPADARGMYSCLLSASNGSAPLEVPRYFFGLSTQGFELKPLSLLPLETSDRASLRPAPTYHSVHLEDMVYVASPSAVCVRTAWMLNQPTDENMSVAAGILNPIGEIIARSDAEIADRENVGTSAWEIEKTGQAYNLLLLPEGAPLLDYDLTITVYTASQPSGFDVLDENGNPMGTSFRLENVIRAEGMPLADSVNQPVLQADNAGDNHTVVTGIPLDVTLLLPGNVDNVTLQGEDWSLEQSVQNGGLSWHRFIVPPGNAGEAVLMVDAVELAHFNVTDPERVFDLLPMDAAVYTAFPGVGTLVGVNIEVTTFSRDELPELTLIWQAEGETTIAYTVFVQLISADGVLLAQSDSLPAGGNRPTTGWVKGEYITDTHTLRFNDTPYTGSAYLIAGFYDAENGFQRVMTSEEGDYARLPVEIEVE